MCFLFGVRIIPVIFWLFYTILPCFASHITDKDPASIPRNPYKNLILKNNIPILASSNSSWFQDTRIKLDLNKFTNQHEVNVGIAHRKNLTSSANTLGAYTFWDVSHIKESVFAQQNTFGIEWFNPVMHIASNVYHPLPNFFIPFYEQTTNPKQQTWQNIQQNHIKKQIHTFSGADINFNKKFITSNNSNYELSMRYAYFTSLQYREQGPEIGLHTLAETLTATHVFKYMGATTAQITTALVSEWNDSGQEGHLAKDTRYHTIKIHLLKEM